MAREPEGKPVEFRLLGPLEVAVGGAVLPVGGARQRALLALLLLNANEVVPRERLIDGLWGDDPPATAGNALQVAVHGLRKLLGPERIELRGEGYAAVVQPGELDVERFERLIARARGQPPAAAAKTLAEALALWRGAPLADVGRAAFAAAEAARLEELRLATVEASVEARLACGADEVLVPELEALVEQHPYRERLRRQLMLALYRGGRQADALAAYRQARRALAGLGIDPSAELQALERSILQQDPALAAPRPVREVRLPAPATPLVGRELELASVTALLARPDVRLVTLTGPGGTGKTRLALEAAWHLAGEVDAVFVDLAPLADPRLVVATIADALECEPSLEAVRDRVRAGRALLVLDNFERVEEAAAVVGDLLAAAPGLRVLATSRAPLRLSGEHEYAVPPLTVPEAGLESDLDALGRNQAVQLFLARAAAVRPGYGLTAEQASAIAAICRAVDGLPLALELAAARLRTMSADELRERLARRLDVLTGAPRDAPTRHQTLRATIDWSFDLLSPDEQKVFRRLAVFAGRFDSAAAEQVCDATAEVLEGLVARSLLHADPEQGRFRMLETVREYAREQLLRGGDADEMERRHAEHYLRLAEEAAPLLLTADGGPLLAKLDADLDNLRTALAASRALGLDELHLRVCGELWRFWYVRASFAEGRRWLEEALEDADAQPAPLRAAALKALGILANEHGDPEEGQERASAALALYREIGDERGMLASLTVLGNAARKAGALDDARRSFEKSGELARRLERPEDVAVSLSNLASLAVLEEDLARAEELLGESLAITREVGREDAVALALVNLGYAHLRRDRPREAAAALAEAAEISSRLGFRANLLNALVVLAAAAAALDAPQTAARLAGAVAAISRSAAAEPLEPGDPELLAGTTASVRAQLGDEAYAAAFEDGRSDPDGVVAETAVELSATAAEF